VPGQNQTVYMSGSPSGQYYIASDSNTGIAAATTNGSSLSLTGYALGTATVSVCASGLQCSTLYVTVSSSAPTPVSNLPPVLSSFTVSSNGANNSFMGTGSALTLSFNINQPVTGVEVTVNGAILPVSGSGSGPYTSAYTMTGNEALPLPITIGFTSSAGAPSRLAFSLGAPAVVSTPSPVVSTAPAPSSSSGSYSFDRYLYMGMTAIGVADPDVTALQQRLTADGLYSGPITGYFGPLTQAAVETYQSDHGLSPVGVVGPGTRQLLDQGI
jgi:hypothetical protein